MENHKQQFAHLPSQSKPRERLKEYGAKALANHELLAILLRTGTRQENVLQLSLRVLSEFDDLYMFRQATFEELTQIPGIGNAKAVEILATIELGSRVSRTSRIKEGIVTSSKFVGEMLIEEIGGLNQENVIALYLNTKNELLKREIIFKGSLNSSVAHPREIFKGAIRASAARIIVGHNHPSGNPEPSEADIKFTERLQQAGEIVGIEVLDHIIVGEHSYISLSEYGVL